MCVKHLWQMFRLNTRKLTMILQVWSIKYTAVPYHRSCSASIFVSIARGHFYHLRNSVSHTHIIPIFYNYLLEPNLWYYLTHYRKWRSTDIQSTDQSSLFLWLNNIVIEEINKYIHIRTITHCEMARNNFLITHFIITRTVLFH